MSTAYLYSERVSDAPNPQVHDAMDASDTKLVDAAFDAKNCPNGGGRGGPYYVDDGGMTDGGIMAGGR